MSELNKLTRGNTVTEHIDNLNNLIDKINDLLSTIDKYSKVTTTGKFSDLLEIPEEFQPKAHNHLIADITDLIIPTNINELIGYDKLALKSELPTDYIPSSLKGVANGLAELDITGKIPTSQLPSYVDDVIEGYFISDTEFNDINDTLVTIEPGKIYADVDTNYIYRWSGTKLTRITGNLVLGETSSTAFRGDYGRMAYDHAKSEHAPLDANKNVQVDWDEEDSSLDSYLKNKPNLGKVATSNKYNDLDGLPNIPTVTNDLTDSLKAKYDVAYNHSQSSHAPTTVATTSANGLMSSTDKNNVDANTTARHTHSNKSALDTISMDWINSLASQMFVNEKINAITTPDVSKKLEASNIIAGDNITLSTDENNITINSTASGGQIIYDLVIRTQEEFEAFYTTLDEGTCTAKSVLFVGDGGTLEFTRSDEKGINLPNTLIDIHGINNPIITINNFNTYSGGVFGYSSNKQTSKIPYNISNITLNVNAITSSCRGFRYMKNMSNCILKITTSGSMYGYENCYNIYNCIVDINSSGGTSIYGFRNCENLHGIESSVLSNGSSSEADCYFTCNGLYYCTATATGVNKTYCFNGCNGNYYCKGTINGTNIGSYSVFYGGKGFYACEATITNIPDDSADKGSCFYSCNGLYRCKLTMKKTNQITGIIDYGFRSCYCLSGCEATVTNVFSAYYQCNRISNCTATATNTGNAYCYNACTQLSNCLGKSTSSGGSGYVYFNCSYLNGCKADGTSTTGIWTGTNTYRDDNSCQLS